MLKQNNPFIFLKTFILVNDITLKKSALWLRPKRRSTGNRLHPVLQKKGNRNSSYSLDLGEERAWLISSLLKIFPAGDFGIELTNAMRLILLYGATYRKAKEEKKKSNPYFQIIFQVYIVKKMPKTDENYFILEVAQWFDNDCLQTVIKESLELAFSDQTKNLDRWATPLWA